MTRTNSWNRMESGIWVACGWHLVYTDCGLNACFGWPGLATAPTPWLAFLSNNVWKLEGQSKYVVNVMMVQFHDNMISVCLSSLQFYSAAWANIPSFEVQVNQFRMRSTSPSSPPKRSEENSLNPSRIRRWLYEEAARWPTPFSHIVRGRCQLRYNILECTFQNVKTELWVDWFIVFE